MTTGRKLKLAAHAVGLAPSFSQHTDPVRRKYDLDGLVAAAGLLEDAKFDAIFEADAVLFDLEDTDSVYTNLHADATAIAGVHAAVTSRIGLVATATTTFNVPYQLARQFQTLDQLTGGRLGWNAVTSFGGERQFGLSELPDQDVRYERAAEFVDIVQGLWRGWSPDAVTADSAGKPRIHADRIEKLDFHGQFLSAEGALGVPRSPQGWPVQCQAGASEAGLQFAARYAEAIFAASPDIEHARAFNTRLAAAVTSTRGSDGAKPLVFPGFFVIVAPTETEAKDREQAIIEGLDLEAGRHSLALAFGAVVARERDLGSGIDLSDLELDEPIPTQRIAELPDAATLTRRRSRTVLYRNLALSPCAVTRPRTSRMNCLSVQVNLIRPGCGIRNVSMALDIVPAVSLALGECLRNTRVHSDRGLNLREHLSMSTVVKSATGTSAQRSSSPAVVDTVAAVIADVRADGDAAVRKYSEKFDRWTPTSFRLSDDEVRHIVSSVPETVLDDLRFAQKQIRTFAEAQLESMHDIEVETLPGVFLGHRNVPIEAAGAYVPGGRYPLTASAHMTVLTAKVADVDRVAATTPPNDGAAPPVSVAAMHLAGADEIYVLGGVQAIAALALGTETIDPVAILTGPGNAYVAEAKRQLFGEVGIDLFAGPTETLIVADDDADPFTIAVDLLSQAEHGPDSPCVLITTSDRLARHVLGHLEALLPGLQTNAVAGPAWRDHGQIHVVDTIDDAFALADRFASEHVQIFTNDPRRALTHMRNYGAIFLGERTCVPYGDKLIGTNHVLPTLGAARYTGGLWVGKFLKTLTYQEVRDSASSARIGEICGRLSRLERFEGHARSGDLRAARFGGAPLDWAELPSTSGAL